MTLLETARLLGHGLRLALSAPALLPIGRTSPATLLARRARTRPADLALRYGGLRFTWSEVDAQSDRYAAWLEGCGVRAGTAVAVMMDNRPEFLFAVMGLSRLGAIAALINTHLAGAPLAHALAACGAKIIVTGAEHEAAIRAVTAERVLVQREGDELPPATPRHAPKPRNRDACCYIYTSGTTGLPKAAVMSNQRVLGAAHLFGHLMHQSGPGDVIYVPLPLYHSNALCLGWGAALATGAAVALERRFSVQRFWSEVQATRATSFVYIGELCRYLANAAPHPAERTHRLRVAVGNGLRPDVWERFQRRFGVPIVREFYGSTEGSAFALNVEGRPGMIGRLAPSQLVARCDPTTWEVTRDASGRVVRARPGEVGLLLGRISAFGAFEGYVDSAATSKKILTGVARPGDRWWSSGDLVRLHDGRWLSFVDRLGDTFRWKGENVSTTEVAEVLNAAPGVAETSVYGVEVPGAEGRAGMAAVGVTDAFELASFERYVGRTLAPYQRPHFLRVLAGDLSVTSTYKLQKEDYRREGYDPERVLNRLYLLSSGRYVRLDRGLHERLGRGEVRLG